jgi:UDP-N-acetylglucosamine--N-acetylmuramyl-(pentapeptide) pyrophosphoryl-undecaprenol N-acetylglucosamine transferase
VPYPFAAGGHQDHNAALLASQGAAVVVSGREVSGERLAAVIDALRADGVRRRAMGEASRRLGRPQAAAAVAALAAEAARKERS